MKKLLYLFLISSPFISGFSQSNNCFAIENTLLKNDTDNLFLEYKITNTTKSSVNLVEANKFVYLRFFAWELEITDSLGIKYESSLMIKRKPLSEKDFVCLKPNESFIIKYELLKYDFMIYESGKTMGKTSIKSEQQIKYPLSIKLKYNSDGTYVHSRKGKTKKMKNAAFNCESKVLVLKK